MVLVNENTMLVKDLVARIQEKGHAVDLGVPATPDALHRIESAIGRRLPDSYCAFLLTYGVLSIYDNAISGVCDGTDIDGGRGTVMSDTCVLRSDGGLPDGFVVIAVHDDGAYCLDFNRQRANGECPVVNFTPGSVQHEDPVAATFDDWLVEFFLKPWLKEHP